MWSDNVTHHLSLIHIYYHRTLMINSGEFRGRTPGPNAFISGENLSINRLALSQTERAGTTEQVRIQGGPGGPGPLPPPWSNFEAPVEFLNKSLAWSLNQITPSFTPENPLFCCGESQTCKCNSFFFFFTIKLTTFCLKFLLKYK